MSPLRVCPRLHVSYLTLKVIQLLTPFFNLPTVPGLVLLHMVSVLLDTDTAGRIHVLQKTRTGPREEKGQQQQEHSQKKEGGPLHLSNSWNTARPGLGE